MNHRLERVRELIKRELSEIVTREIDFRASLVTIQFVDVTPDLKHAHVHVSVIGSPAQQGSAIAKLNEHRVLLQHLMSKRVILKYTPRLHFELDDSVEHSVHINKILDGLNIPPDPDVDSENEE